jgi:Icc-related predicted phosphoesterase
LARSIITNAIYLEDEAVVIEGLKFYGSPWQPWYHDWAFNLERGSVIKEKWDMIPADTDVLITHGPPHGILDLTYERILAGCEELALAVDRIKPRLHVFGHIHEAFGSLHKNGVHYVNACSVNLRYKVANQPVIVELTVEDNPIPSKLGQQGIKPDEVP